MDPLTQELSARAMSTGTSQRTNIPHPESILRGIGPHHPNVELDIRDPTYKAAYDDLVSLLKPYMMAGVHPQTAVSNHLRVMQGQPYNWNGNTPQALIDQGITSGNARTTPRETVNYGSLGAVVPKNRRTLGIGELEL